MLRIYLNKKKLELEKHRLIKTGSAEQQTFTDLQGTGSKAAAIELGYALYDVGTVNNGNADIKFYRGVTKN